MEAELEEAALVQVSLCAGAGELCHSPAPGRGGQGGHPDRGADGGSPAQRADAPFSVCLMGEARLLSVDALPVRPPHVTGTRLGRVGGEHLLWGWCCVLGWAWAYGEGVEGVLGKLGPAGGGPYCASLGC